MIFKIFVAVFAVAFCLVQLSDQMTIHSDRSVAVAAETLKNNASNAPGANQQPGKVGNKLVN